MNWLAPDFLMAGAAITLPLALHLLRRRVVRTVPFPALRFLAAARPADQRSQKIRRLVVLALRCLALALLAAAFARPFFNDTAAAGGRATVVVIDNSFSLRSAGRWAALRAWTRDALGQPVEGDTVGLLLMNPRPAWLVAPTHDTAQALAALDTLEPGWEATRAEPALRLAGDVLAAAPARERRLIFMGDHQALGWAGADFSKKLPAGVEAVFPPVPPAPARQAAVLAVRLTRTDDAATVAVTLRNFTGAQTRMLRVFSENERTVPLANVSVALAAGETRTVEAPLAFSGALTYVRVELDADDLPADDVAWAIAPAARGDRLLLLDRPPAGVGADYLNTAYAALGTVPPGLRVAPLPASPWPTGAVAVLRNDSSFAGESATRLDAFLAAGGGVLVFLEGGPAQAAWLAAHGGAPRALEGNARLRDWAVDHPLVAPLAEHGLRGLVGWEFGRGWALPETGFEPLAFWADGGVAIGEWRRGAGRMLVAGFAADRRDGDWPVQGAFVPFVHRAATYLLGLAGANAEVAPRVGVALSLPEGRGRWEALAGPAMGRPAREISGAVTPDAPGVYAFSRPGEPRQLYAVGLSPDESDPAPWSQGAPWAALASPEKSASASASVVRRLQLADAEAEQQSGLWWWCFAAMALFALAELGIANRTAR